MRSDKAYEQIECGTCCESQAEQSKALIVPRRLELRMHVVYRKADWVLPPQPPLPSIRIQDLAQKGPGSSIYRSASQTSSQKIPRSHHIFRYTLNKRFPSCLGIGAVALRALSHYGRLWNLRELLQSRFSSKLLESEPRYRRNWCRVHGPQR